jgi:hypothetical protein
MSIFRFLAKQLVLLYTDLRVNTQMYLSQGLKSSIS